MLEVIFGVVAGVAFLLLIATIYSNRFHLVIMKIDKAEEDIDMYLVQKKELLDRTRPIVMKEVKLEEFIPEIEINFDTINNFEENEILKKAYNELLHTIDENDKLLKSDALTAILDSLNENEENIVGAIRFYNDTVVEFNHLILSFPSNIIAFFKRYHKKDFYKNEKREMYEILNDK